MLKVVINAVVFTCLAVFVFVLVNRIPVIRAFRDCYAKAYTILNEKHTITRTTYISDGQICLDHKKILVEAATCEQDVDKENRFGPREWTILNNLGHLAASGTLTMTEMIDSHNQQCPSYTQKVQFDHRSKTWF